MRSIQSLLRFVFEVSYNDEDVDEDVEINVLGCRADVLGQTMTNACAWFSVTLRPQKP